MKLHSLNKTAPVAPVKVLLVDDEEDAYVLTRNLFAKIHGGNFKLDWVSTYQAGQEAFRRHGHDVYLLDYRLGARNGLELLREALALGCQEPIILLTAENPKVDAEAMRLGAADFLNKDRLDASLLERSIRYSIKHFKTLQALRESEAQLLSFMQNVPCAVCIKNPKGQYLYVNETCAKVFGRKPQDWIGRTDDELWSARAAQTAKAADDLVLADKKNIETTETVVNEDGTHFWLTTKFPILNELGNPIMIGAAAIDITEIKRLEKEIQEVSEQEKRRIGQDLHDGLGQYLTGVACLTKALEQKLAAKALSEAEDARKITAIVNQTISQARDLARGLSPVELDNHSLESALQELANSAEQLFKVKCRFAAAQPIPIYDNAAAIHLYRIAQEAVNNAIRHGQAGQIEIGLTSGPGQVTVAVTDDGVGLPKGYQKTKGMGLRIMNYRAGMIGATITVEASPAGGTVLRCAVPNSPPSQTQGS